MGWCVTAGPQLRSLMGAGAGTPQQGALLLKAHSYTFFREVTSAEWKPVQLGGYATPIEVMPQQ